MIVHDAGKSHRLIAHGSETLENAAPALPQAFHRILHSTQALESIRVLNQDFTASLHVSQALRSLWDEKRLLNIHASNEWMILAGYQEFGLDTNWHSIRTYKSVYQGKVVPPDVQYLSWWHATERTDRAEARLA